MESLLELIAARNAAIHQWSLLVLTGVLAWELYVRRRAHSGAVADHSDTDGLPTTSPWLASIERYWWPALFAVAVLLRVWLLDTGPYWYDEAFTAWVAGLPFGKMLEALVGDVHPPLWYVLVWVMAHLFGDAPWVLRLLPAALSIAALPLTKRLADHLRLPMSVQSIGLMLMALSRYQLHASSELRMYALLQVLVLAAVICVFERRWAALALAWAAMLWTHHYGFIFGAVTAALALVLHWPRVRNVLLAGVTALVCYTPWAAVTVAQIELVQGGHWIWPVSPAEVVMLFYSLLFNDGPPGLEMLALSAAIALAAFTAFKAVRYPQTPERAALTWLVVGPILLAVLISVLWRPVFVGRYLFALSPFLFLLIGWAMTHQVGPRAVALVVCGLTVLVGLGGITALQVRAEVVERGRAPEIAALIRRDWQPRDVVVHTNIWSRIEAQQLLGDIPHYLYPPPGAGLNIGGLSAPTRQALGLREARSLRDIPDWRRAWVVVVSGVGIEPQEVRQAFTDLCGAGCQRVAEWTSRRELYRVEVYQAWNY